MKILPLLSYLLSARFATIGSLAQDADQPKRRSGASMGQLIVARL